MWMKFISARPLDMQIENVQTGPIHAPIAGRDSTKLNPTQLALLMELLSISWPVELSWVGSGDVTTDSFLSVVKFWTWWMTENWRFSVESSWVEFLEWSHRPTRLKSTGQIKWQMCRQDTKAAPTALTGALGSKNTNYNSKWRQH